MLPEEISNESESKQEAGNVDERTHLGFEILEFE